MEKGDNILKKLILVLLIGLLVGSLAITATAKVNLLYYTQTSISVEGLQPGEYEQKIIDEFETLYPNVEIALEVIPYAGDQGKIELSIAAGMPPDILADDRPRMMKYADAGILVDFEDTIDKTNFYDFAINASSYKGKIYYYPMGVRNGSMMASKSFAEKHGLLEYLPLEGDRGWNTEDFENLLVKANEILPEEDYAFCMNFADGGAWGHLLMQFTGFGGNIFVEKDGKFKCIANNPEMKEGLQFYLDVYNKYPNAIPQGAETITIVDLDNLWTSGHLLLCPGSVNQRIKELQGTANIGFDLALFPYPSKEGVLNGVPADWCGFMVFDNKDAEKAKYAKLFVKYFVDNAPDLTGANYNTSPVQKDIPIPIAFEQFKDDSEISYALGTHSKYSKDIGNACPAMSQFKEQLLINMQGVLIGEITLDECLRIVEKKTNEYLDEFYSE